MAETTPPDDKLRCTHTSGAQKQHSNRSDSAKVQFPSLRVRPPVPVCAGIPVWAWVMLLRERAIERKQYDELY